MFEADARLKVLIIGAGIAGLSAGVMLREFANVTILEAAPELKEVGAAVTMGPGVVAILRRYGIHLEQQGGVVTEELCIWQSDGALLAQHAFHAKERAGEEIISIHRADLQAALLSAATSADGPGVPCKLLLDHRVASVDADAGTATLASGAVLTADVLLAADGIHSPARRFILLDGDSDGYMRPDKRRLSVPPPRFSPELDGSDGDGYMHPHAGDKRVSPEQYDERDSKRLRPNVGAYIRAPASTTLELSMLEQWSAAHPEVRQRARERWTKCTLEEWQQGAEEFGERFKQILKIATGDMMKRQQVYAECFGKVRERSALVAAREVELGHALEAIRRDGQSVISGGSDIGGDGEDGFEDGEVQEGKDGE